METKQFSRMWKSSTKARKQRKYHFNAPLHLKQKQVHVHLSPELRQRYGFRNVQVRKGDKVKVVHGQFSRKEGKVEKVLLQYQKVLMHGVEVIRKDGTKKLFPLHPSNLMILELDLGDKRRKEKIESRSKTKTAKKTKEAVPEGKKTK